LNPFTFKENCCRIALQFLPDMLIAWVAMEMYQQGNWLIFFYVFFGLVILHALFEIKKAVSNELNYRLLMQDHYLARARETFQHAQLPAAKPDEHIYDYFQRVVENEDTPVHARLLAQQKLTMFDTVVAANPLQARHIVHAYNRVLHGLDQPEPDA